jgi:hypothetical protein
MHIAVENVRIPRNGAIRADVDVLGAGDRDVEVGRRLAADFQVGALQDQDPGAAGDPHPAPAAYCLPMTSGHPGGTSILAPRSSRRRVPRKMMIRPPEMGAEIRGAKNGSLAIPRQGSSRSISLQ